MIHCQKLSYDQYLNRVQKRGSQNAKAQLCKLLKREHIRSEFTAVALFIAALITYMMGLHMAPVACVAIACVILCSDIYDRIRERRAGF